MTGFDGSADRLLAERNLAGHLPPSLAPLATLAYNYWWTWRPEIGRLFASIDPERWQRCGENPIRLLQEVSPLYLDEFARRDDFAARAEQHAADLRAYLEARPPGSPVAYLCAEFGVHRSLPFYAGGLGVLAGDYLKEASDLGAPMVGLGLFYREGAFHQRLDTSGWQHEYWEPIDADRLPAVVVSGDDGPLHVSVSIRGRPVRAQVWRVDVGASLLYLLDSDIPGNDPADRWITARLYVAGREMRLAQYALLGIGGIRALRAMGIEPALVHLNEGHAALATIEGVRERMERGETYDAAVDAVRARTVFTTHTPVAAGNESFGRGHMEVVLPDLAEQSGIPEAELWRLARDDGRDESSFGLTPLALRLSAAANGVSRLHGEVARAMWSAIRPADGLGPIGQVTNGVHMPTWMAPEWQALLDRYVPGWRDAPAGDPAWNGIDDIPDDEIWTIRCELRRHLAMHVRERSVRERLGRGEHVAYAESAVGLWLDDALTIGFARRIATYKRLYLLTSQPDRAVRILTGQPPVQIVIAGRAHSEDEPAKGTVQRLFGVNDIPGVGGRAVFLEEYDMALARRLVQGCDLWLNLPHRLEEASGTSGMKSSANGGLQLSVLDGWWAEAWGPSFGWAIPSAASLSREEQDERDADLCFELIEREVIPLFYDRDERGIPGAWVAMIRGAMKELVPRFSATRMAREYEQDIYASLRATSPR